MFEQIVDQRLCAPRFVVDFETIYLACRSAGGTGDRGILLPVCTFGCMTREGPPGKTVARRTHGCHDGRMVGSVVILSKQMTQVCGVSSPCGRISQHLRYMRFDEGLSAIEFLPDRVRTMTSASGSSFFPQQRASPLCAVGACPTHLPHRNIRRSRGRLTHLSHRDSTHRTHRNARASTRTTAQSLVRNDRVWIASDSQTDCGSGDDPPSRASMNRQGGRIRLLTSDAFRLRYSLSSSWNITTLESSVGSGYTTVPQ